VKVFFLWVLNRYFSIRMGEKRGGGVGDLNEKKSVNKLGFCL